MNDHQTLLREALAARGCEIGTLHVLEGGVLRLKAHLGLPPQVAAVVDTVPIGKGMAGLAAERLKPVQTCNLQTDTTGDIRPGAKAVPVQASVAVPMMVDGDLRGVVGFARADYHEWNEEELEGLAAEASDLGRKLGG